MEPIAILMSPIGQTYTTDPSGELTVKPLWHTNLSPFAFCNKLIDASWDFVLDRPAPCNGYFVQQNDIYCLVKNCGKCTTVCPTKPAIRFWEAFTVFQGDTKTIGRVLNPNQVLYTDHASYFPDNNTYGTYYARGTIKFYCRDKNAKGARGVGTGDLGVEGQPPLDPKSPWRPGVTYGARPCAASPGERRHMAARSQESQRPLPFWGLTPVEGPATRVLSVFWNCCPKEKQFVMADAEPRNLF